MLERFLGFHLVWERAIRQRAALRSFLESRSRPPHLRRDLALGLTNAEQAALADADRRSPGGLTCFNPYRGRRTGKMWRSFAVWAEANVANDQPGPATAGANRTLALLQGWLAS